MSTAVDQRVRGVRRIAVLRANGIGDFVMIVPALEALRRAYPDAAITVIGDSWLPDLLRDRPGPWTDTVVAPTFPGLRGLSPDGEPGADLDDFVARHRGYDLVLQMHGGGRNSNRLTRLLHPRVSVGPCAPDATPLDRSLPYVSHRHEILRWLEVVEMVGGRGADGTAGLAPRVAVTEHDLAESREAFASDRPFAVFHVGTRDERRRWPAERFTQLARHLQRAHSLHTVLVGGPTDQPPSAEVADALGDAVTDLSGRLSLPATVGLASRSRVYIGNDSGPRHLAAAAGAPTVGIFWVGNLLNFGPLAGAHRAPTSFRTTCPVCGALQVTERCPHDVSFVADVTLDEAAEAVDSLLAQLSERCEPR